MIVVAQAQNAFWRKLRSVEIETLKKAAGKPRIGPDLTRNHAVLALTLGLIHRRIGAAEQFVQG